MKKILSVFLMSFIVFALSACNADVVKIEDYEWEMRTVMSNDTEAAQYQDELVVAVGEADELYPDAEIVDMTLTAKDGEITITDTTNGKTYNGTYEVMQKTPKGTDYEIIIDGVNGYATVAPTEYYDGSEIPTLPINIDGYSLYFIPMSRNLLRLEKGIMMKIEIEKDFPQYFKPAYPEEFELFSHFEVTAGIPTVLFAVTTWKENGKPNVCFHSWSCFHGDKTAFFAVMGNLYQHTHTYANIQREKCFCINFLPISCYDRLVNTIHQNEWDDDEFAAGGFTVSNAKTIHAPAISEAFLTMECTLKDIQDLSGAGITAMVIGQVQHISVEEAYAQGYELRYGKDGFMLLVPAPQDLVTGEPNQSAIATVHIEKYD